MRNFGWLSVLIIAILSLLTSCSKDEIGKYAEPTKYKIAISVTPDYSGSISPKIEDSYKDGSEVTFVATPLDGYEFVGWEGDITSAEPTLEFTVKRDYDLTAKFEKVIEKGFKIVAIANPKEGGVITRSPNGTNNTGYENEEDVILTANSLPGWKFAGWSGDIISSNTDITIKAEKDYNVVANFVQLHYTVVVNTEGQGSVARNPDGGNNTAYQHGDVITITATPASGWRLARWTGDASGDANPIQITISNETTNITAVFEEISKFYQASNGVTVMCPAAVDGESGTVNGVTYTKRTAAQIKADPSLAATSCTSGITDLTGVFQGQAAFNEDISTWDVSSVTNMTNLFNGANSFNQDIGYWDVGNVTKMNNIFANARAFNQDISGWNVSKVETFNYAFSNAEVFNQSIGNWNTSSMNTPLGMFQGAAEFNQDISGWDVSKSRNMSHMFHGAANFNQNISGWNTSSAINMAQMFQDAKAFNQDLSSWDVSKVTTYTDFNLGADLLTENHLPKF